MKTYVLGAHWNSLSEAIPMGTQNICFHEDDDWVFYIMFNIIWVILRQWMGNNAEFHL